MPTTISWATSSTNQNRPKVKISNFWVFCPVWVKFGIWANNGPKITWYKFEMVTATYYASTKTPHIPSRTIILFRYFVVVFCCFCQPSSLSSPSLLRRTLPLSRLALLFILDVRRDHSSSRLLRRHAAFSGSTFGVDDGDEHHFQRR